MAVKNEEKIANRDLIVASGIVMVGISAFYAFYLVGRFVGSLLFA